MILMLLKSSRGIVTEVEPRRDDANKPIFIPIKHLLQFLHCGKPLAGEWIEGVRFRVGDSKPDVVQFVMPAKGASWRLM